MRYFDFLARLEQISAAVNLTQRGADRAALASTLKVIAAAAEQVTPGAQCVLLEYDPDENTMRRALDRPTETEDLPAADIIAAGLRAAAERRSLFWPDETETTPSGARAGACLPLLVEQQAVGALFLSLRPGRPLNQVELLYLQTLAHLAASIVHQARWQSEIQHDLARKEEEAEQLRRSSLLISSRLRLEETLEAILQMALEVTDAHYGIFRLLDKNGQNLITRAVAGELLEQPLVEALPCDSASVMGWVARNRQPALIADLRHEPWNKVYYPLDAGLEMRSELAVPLVGAGGRLEGVLNLESPDIAAFSESDSHLLQSLATQAVIAIQEARLLDALQEAAQLLLSQPGGLALARLAELACDLLNAASSAIWTRKDTRLELRASSGSGEHAARLPVQGSLAGAVMRTRAPIATDDVRSDPRFHETALAEIYGWTRALVVPLLVSEEHEALGAFAVYSAGGDIGHFAESEWDKKVLICLAYYAALAVQNSADREALRAAQEQRSVAETFAAVGDITANVLHHLNNKVGTIPVRVQGIQDKRAALLEKDDYLAANLREIERSANEAMEAVRENLANLRPITLAEVGVAACVFAAIEAAALPGAIRLHLSGLENLPPVIAAQRSLTLVFTNLLENAADAMAGAGEITIQGNVRGQWVEISLADSGPGIPPELHERIFEPNYSARGQLRHHRLGFGLWWVKTLMARLGGSVMVESDGQHGSTFRLLLPAAEKHP